MKAYFTERRTIRNVYYITNGAAMIFMREEGVMGRRRPLSKTLALMFSISLLRIFLKIHKTCSFISRVFVFHYFNVNLVLMEVRT